MKMKKWLTLLSASLAVSAAAFAISCGGDNSSTSNSSSDSSSVISSSIESSSSDEQTVTKRFTVGGTTNVSVSAGETVYCAIDAASGSYVLEWDSPYAKITVGDKTYTTENKLELKNITEETVITVTTTDGGRATIGITCTVWQPPMLSLGENADTEVGAGEKAVYRFAAPHAGIYTFKTESAAVSAFAIFSDKAFANPTPLTAAGALTIEVQAGAEIQIELEQKGASTQIVPITVADETNAQTAEIVDSTAIVSAPASGRAYYILPLGQDSYITWRQPNLALTIAGKEYSGAQNEPILVKYDARSTVYLVARSIDGNAVENAALTLQTATTSTKLTAGESSFVVPKNKSAICTFTAPENGTYTFDYSGSTSISSIDFTSGVNFPVVLAMTTDVTAKTLTATVVKGAELVIELTSEKTKAASVVVNVSSEALQTQTLDAATTVEFSLSHGEFICYEIAAQNWYKVNYTTDLTADLWQFSCAVNHSQIQNNETGYATAGDLLIVKATLMNQSATISGSFTLEADTTISGTTSSVLAVGENNVIVRGETKECTFTATESGTYRISTSDPNAKIIYKLGATNADNACITGANDGIESSVEIELKAGETYTIYIEMLQTTIDDNNEETIDPTVHLDVLSFTIEKIA